MRLSAGRFGALGIALITAVACGSEPDEISRHTVAAVRRPIALVRIQDSILTGNRETGSVSILESDSLSVTGEFRVAGRLDDLVAATQSGPLLGVDSRAHELILIDVRQPPFTGSRLDVAQRATVSRYPVSVVVMPDARLASVASKWSRRLTIVSLLPEGAERIRVTRTIDLPFAPGKQLVLDNRHVLVADAFAGQLAIVDAQSGTIRSRRLLNGHNIRGLTLTADAQQVQLTHQIMLSITATTRSRISWGGVVSNSLHTIPVADLLTPAAPVDGRPRSIYGRLYPLGEDRNAAGDPAGVASAEDGRTFVALSGIHEVCLKRTDDLELLRREGGRRPTAILFDEQANRLIVANTSDDSISLFEGNSLVELKRMSLGPAGKRTARQLGEELFYDARFSLDGWYSCHSCHSDGHSTGRLNDNFSDHSFGTPKRILSLLGVADTKPWAWDGSETSLESQVRSSIELTMAGPGKGSPAVNEENVAALAEYLRSLPPAPSVANARGEFDRAAVARGQTVFTRHGCADCHRPPAFTSTGTFDVGIHDAAGLRTFNPPSLRGLSQRGPYFHDNRAATLRELIDQHDHDAAAALPATEKEDLIQFLKSL